MVQLSIFICYCSAPCPPGIYLLKVNNRNARTRCEICSKLTMKILKQRHWCRSGAFIEHISHFFLIFYCYLSICNCRRDDEFDIYGNTFYPIWYVSNIRNTTVCQIYLAQLIRTVPSPPP